MGTVVSDLEGTLSTGETWKAVGRYLVAHGRRLRYMAFFAVHLPGALLAKAGLVDLYRFQAQWMTALARLLRGMTETELAQMAEEVVECDLWPGRRTEVLAELQEHLKTGHRVVITSGSYLPVVLAFARRVGAEAMGSALEVRQGRLTGRLTAGINTGAIKTARLEAELAGETFEAAYGDSIGDLGMLQMSRGPVAVHPDPPLRRRAAAHGWRVLE